jgi:hypothetical protein
MTLGGAESKQQISPMIQKQNSTNKLSATYTIVQNWWDGAKSKNEKRDQTQAEIKTDILSPK